VIFSQSKREPFAFIQNDWKQLLISMCILILSILESRCGDDSSIRVEYKAQEINVFCVLYLSSGTIDEI
jgi:hypothetical protein